MKNDKIRKISLGLMAALVALGLVVWTKGIQNDADSGSLHGPNQTTTETQSNESEKAAQTKTRAKARSKATSLTVVVSSGCQPCARLKPVLKELQSDGYNIKVIDYSDYSGNERISSVPALLYYKDGKLLTREVGYKSKKHIESKLSK